MAKGKRIQKVGTSTNKNSDIIKRQADFVKRWNVKLNENNFDTFKNRIIVILSSAFSSYSMSSIESELFYNIGLPYVKKEYMEFSFSFDMTNLYRVLNRLDMTNQKNQLLLILLLENLLNSSYGIGAQNIAKQISEAIILSGVDVQLCKRGTEYLFYPSGAELLDIKVVNDTLNWLEDYPKARAKFHEGLLLQQRHFPIRQVIDTMRLALELFIKQYNDNEKSLENQKEQLGKYLKERNVAKEIRDMFSSLFSFYTTYINQNVKHNDSCAEVESEYIIYLTGTFIRFLINVKKQEEQNNV